MGFSNGYDSGYADAVADMKRKGGGGSPGGGLSGASLRAPGPAIYVKAVGEAGQAPTVAGLTFSATAVEMHPVDGDEYSRIIVINDMVWSLIDNGYIYMHFVLSPGAARFLARMYDAGGWSGELSLGRSPDASPLTSFDDPVYDPAPADVIEEEDGGIHDILRDDEIESMVYRVLTVQGMRGSWDVIRISR